MGSLRIYIFPRFRFEIIRELTILLIQEVGGLRLRDSVLLNVAVELESVSMRVYGHCITVWSDFFYVFDPLRGLLFSINRWRLKLS